MTRGNVLKPLIEKYRVQWEPDTMGTQSRNKTPMIGFHKPWIPQRVGRQVIGHLSLPRELQTQLESILLICYQGGSGPRKYHQPQEVMEVLRAPVTEQGFGEGGRGCQSWNL